MLPSYSPSRRFPIISRRSATLSPTLLQLLAGRAGRELACTPCTGEYKLQGGEYRRLESVAAPRSVHVQFEHVHSRTVAGSPAPPHPLPVPRMSPPVRVGLSPPCRPPPGGAVPPHHPPAAAPMEPWFLLCLSVHSLVRCRCSNSALSETRL